jgi:hypothetical protein
VVLVRGSRKSDVDRVRQAFLRRLDIEHNFRVLKQTLGVNGI